MTKSPIVAAVLACLVVVSLAVLPAAGQTGQPAPRSNIALLDINYIFKNNTRFKAMMADMKTEVERAEQALKSQRDAIQVEQEKLKDFKTGSEQYKQKEQEVARRMADLNIQAQVQRKDFLLKESRIYYTVYREIEEEVAYFASSQGISLVMKINAEAVEDDDPDGVLRYINQDVVWAAQGMNITQIISDRLNARAGTANRTNAPTGVPVPSSRPGVPFPRR